MFGKKDNMARVRLPLLDYKIYNLLKILILVFLIVILLLTLLPSFALRLDIPLPDGYVKLYASLIWFFAAMVLTHILLFIERFFKADATIKYACIFISGSIAIFLIMRIYAISKNGVTVLGKGYEMLCSFYEDVYYLTVYLIFMLVVNIISFLMAMHFIKNGARRTALTVCSLSVPAAFLFIALICK